MDTNPTGTILRAAAYALLAVLIALAAAPAPGVAQAARPTPGLRPTAQPRRPTGQQARTTPPARPTPIATPVAASDPAGALGACASDIFGLSPAYTRSGGLTSTIARTLNVPIQSRGTVTATVGAGSTAVYGLMSDGLQTLAYGSGSASGADAAVAIGDASLCYLQLVRTQQMPADADAALALLKQTFPGVPQDAAYTAKAVKGGYAFTLTTTRRSRDGTATSQAIVLTALSSGTKGKLILGATSGIGTFAAIVPA